jgi:hypothetical protein
LANDACELTSENLATKIKSIFDWKFVLLGSPKGVSVERTFFLGMGRTKVYQYNAAGRTNPWQKTDENLKFELPAGKIEKRCF